MDNTITETSTLARVRLTDRVGIVPRLLICSIAAILGAVACVQLWTLRSVEANGLQRAQESLGISMAIPPAAPASLKSNEGA